MGGQSCTFLVKVPNSGFYQHQLLQVVALIQAFPLQHHSVGWCVNQSLSRAKCPTVSALPVFLLVDSDMSKPVTLCNSNKISYIYIGEQKLKYKGLDRYFVLCLGGRGVHAGGQVGSVSWCTVWARV